MDIGFYVLQYNTNLSESLLKDIFLDKIRCQDLINKINFD